MKGFFCVEDAPEQSKVLSVCPCGLHRLCHSPKMVPSGEGMKKILVIAEAPGEQEDKQGIQLVGRAGQLFRYHLNKCGIDLEKDCRKTNAVRCRPPENRKPTPMEIRACHDHLWKEIKEHPPKLILLLGQSALESFLINRFNDIRTISRWNGFVFPDFKSGCWVAPMFHPSYLLHEGDDVLKVILDRDLKHALKCSCSSVESRRIKDDIVILNNIEDVKIPSEIAFDYETNSLSPFSPNGKIVCCSFSDGEKTYAFPMNEKTGVKWKQVLSNPTIKKIAQNMKFEHQWGEQYLKVRTKGWVWDTMIASHVIDNRRYITGLKFQALVNFGIMDYSSVVETELKRIEQGLQNDPSKRLMEYCGKDSLYTFHLAQKQRRELKTKEGYDLFHEGILSLSDVESKGIHIDVPYLENQSEKITYQLAVVKRNLEEMEEGNQWKKMSGAKLNFSSPTQLSKLLFGVLKYKPTKSTFKGKSAVDDEVLKRINTPFSRSILTMRKYEKVKGTYIEGLLREQKGGRLHPSFNLHLVSTYRSSSDRPNFQNIPVRDPVQGSIVRRAFIPHNDHHQIGEVDYQGIEIRIAACYHKDPAMIAYIEDPTKDLHRDMAAECYQIHPDQVTKKMRYCGKNCFVFPAFYGSYFIQIASALWNAIDEYKLTSSDGHPLREWLSSRGIKRYTAFENYIESVENNFWTKRFPIYRQWKKEWYDKYLKNGYLNTLTGFSCGGAMRRNEVINYPIQGSAFHCLLWSLIQIRKWLVRNKMKTAIIGQIHDSIVFDFVPQEVDRVLPAVEEIMCNAIRKYWQWIIVPLDIEIELAPIGKSWNDKTKHDEDSLGSNAYDAFSRTHTMKEHECD